MILDKIAASTRKRVEEQKTLRPLAEIKKEALALEKGSFPFEAALRREELAFICEIKKASPSKGVIAEQFPYLLIAEAYEAAGAAAISVLTEPDFFLGSTRYLTEIREKVHLPLLRKDFIVDEYQLYESKIIGADAILLICALLDAETIEAYIAICDQLGLSALVEAHNEQEVKAAVSAGARVIGVNNRDLNTFEVDINNSVRLRALIPDQALYVAESGIKTATDIDTLRRAKVNAVLIGETLMRSSDKKRAIMELRGS